MNARRSIFALALGGVGMLALAFRHGQAPLYIWNASASVPLGLYRLQTTGERYVGELVAVCPPEPLASFMANRRYLPRGIPMLKHVLALSGQTVCREGLTVFVDAIAMGDARMRDGHGRPLPIWQGCRVIAPGELFLMNWQAADSLDGRYFGPIPSFAVIARAHPLWTEKED